MDIMKMKKFLVLIFLSYLSFNLNFFLNDTCKDAMNMSDFIENMEVSFKDIENIGKQGYVTGMTDMILTRIKELDVTKRPLHCTDLKRETMYIKDNNEWSKDTPDNSKLHKSSQTHSLYIRCASKSIGEGPIKANCLYLFSKCFITADISELVSHSLGLFLQVLGASGANV